MTLIALTDRQRAELEGAVMRPPSAKECCRVQALLWLADGESAEGVADLLHVSRQTVYNWVSRFHERAGLDLGTRLRDARGPAAVSSTRTRVPSDITRRSGPHRC